MLFAAYTYRMTNRRKRYDPKKQFAVSPQTCDKSRNQSHREDHPSGGPKPPVRTGDEFHYVFLLILVKIDRFWVPDSPGAFRAVFGPPPDRVLQTTRCGRPRDEFEHESRHQEDDDDDDDGDDDHDDGKDDDDGDDDDTDEPIS